MSRKNDLNTSEIVDSYSPAHSFKYFQRILCGRNESDQASSSKKETPGNDVTVENEKASDHSEKQIILDGKDKGTDIIKAFQAVQKRKNKKRKEELANVMKELHHLGTGVVENEATSNAREPVSHVEEPTSQALKLDENPEMAPEHENWNSSGYAGYDTDSGDINESAFIVDADAHPDAQGAEGAETMPRSPGSQQQTPPPGIEATACGNNVFGHLENAILWVPPPYPGQEVSCNQLIVEPLAGIHQPNTATCEPLDPNNGTQVCMQNVNLCMPLVPNTRLCQLNTGTTPCVPMVEPSNTQMCLVNATPFAPSEPATVCARLGFFNTTPCVPLEPSNRRPRQLSAMPCIPVEPHARTRVHLLNGTPRVALQPGCQELRCFQPPVQPGQMHATLDAPCEPQPKFQRAPLHTKMNSDVSCQVGEDNLKKFVAGVVGAPTAEEQTVCITIGAVLSAFVPKEMVHVGSQTEPDVPRPVPMISQAVQWSASPEPKVPKWNIMMDEETQTDLSSETPTYPPLPPTKEVEETGCQTDSALSIEKADRGCQTDGKQDKDLTLIDSACQTDTEARKMLVNAECQTDELQTSPPRASSRPRRLSSTEVKDDTCQTDDAVPVEQAEVGCQSDLRQSETLDHKEIVDSECQAEIEQVKDVVDGQCQTDENSSRSPPRETNDSAAQTIVLHDEESPLRMLTKVKRVVYTCPSEPYPTIPCAPPCLSGARRSPGRRSGHPSSSMSYQPLLRRSRSEKDHRPRFILPKAPATRLGPPRRYVAPNRATGRSCPARHGAIPPLSHAPRAVRKEPRANTRLREPTSPAPVHFQDECPFPGTESHSGCQPLLSLTASEERRSRARSSTVSTGCPPGIPTRFCTYVIPCPQSASSERGVAPYMCPERGVVQCLHPGRGVARRSDLPQEEHRGGCVRLARDPGLVRPARRRDASAAAQQCDLCGQHWWNDLQGSNTASGHSAGATGKPCKRRERSER